MTKNNSKKNNNKSGQINREGEVLTTGKFKAIFEDIKNLIKSTAKGTETILRKEMAKGFAETHGAIKSVKEDVEELRSEMKDMETRLKNELASKEELKDMEGRLSDKIDTIGTRLDDHESKPVGIAHPSQ